MSVALLTSPGRGALAVVGVAGPAADRLVDRCFQPRGSTPVAVRPGGAICVGRWRAARSHAGEELVVVRHRADLVEVHCHGGLAAPAAVIDSLVAAGARRESWAAWCERTGDSPNAIEAREALGWADGPRSARILARQLAGALDRELERIDRLWAAGDAATAAAIAGTLLRASRVGLRLTRPWRVVLAGAVNAGKSSLVNALAGHPRCLVSPLPGTTRDLLETRIVLDGWEVDLVDTAGLRDGSASLGATERAGIAKAEVARSTADLVLRVIPATGFARERTVPQQGEMLVVSKCDDDCDPGPVPDGTFAATGTNDGCLDGQPALRTSAATGIGIAALATRIIAALVPEAHQDPDLLAGAVPFTPRQVAAVRRRLSPPSSTGRGREA